MAMEKERISHHSRQSSSCSVDNNQSGEDKIIWSQNCQNSDQMLNSLIDEGESETAELNSVTIVDIPKDIEPVQALPFSLAMNEEDNSLSPLSMNSTRNPITIQLKALNVNGDEGTKGVNLGEETLCYKSSEFSKVTTDYLLRTSGLSAQIKLKRVDDQAGQFCKRSVGKKTVRKKSELKIRERSHTGDRIYKCFVCEEIFSDKGLRSFHEKIHSEEKPHKCPFCAKVFRKKGNAKKHERNHTKEKRFKCSFCEKFFREKSTRAYHERVHTGEKPFKCSFCVKSFRDKCGRTYHERIHTIPANVGSVAIADTQLEKF